MLLRCSFRPTRRRKGRPAFGGLLLEQRSTVLVGKRTEIFSRKGLGEQISLNLVARLVAKEAFLRLRFHAFRDDGEIKLLAQRDNGLGDGAIVDVGRKIANERARRGH